MAPGSIAIRQRFRAMLADLSPAYFGLVMATGIVSLAASMMGHPALAFALFYLNIGHYAALWILYGLRACLYPRRFFGDMATHMAGPGYFTMVAGTGILANQFFLLHENLAVAAALWLLTLLLWLGATYTIFLAFLIRHKKPALDQGIGGNWLLAVVATQALSLASTLLAARTGQPYRLELTFLALAAWLWGGMFYIWIMGLIFYRGAFFPFSPGHLTPDYWISMGAMAISTLAGSLLILNTPHAPYLASLLPFLKGFTLFYWAAGTWWIPMLVLLEIWRHGLRRFPLRYDPSYWGAVFPLGMYAACTWEMERTMGFTFLSALSRSFFWLALGAWALAFLGMARAIARGLRPGRR